MGKVVSHPRLGGLHLRYTRRAARKESQANPVVKVPKSVGYLGCSSILSPTTNSSLL